MPMEFILFKYRFLPGKCFLENSSIYKFIDQEDFDF